MPRSAGFSEMGTSKTNLQHALVMKLVDMTDLKSVELAHAGSTPA
jgi:hypothetical protein